MEVWNGRMLQRERKLTENIKSYKINKKVLLRNLEVRILKSNSKFVADFFFFGKFIPNSR